MLEDKALAHTGLGQLKAAFGIFGANKQKFPLYYESESSTECMPYGPFLTLNRRLGRRRILSDVCDGKHGSGLWQHSVQ